jgi:type I restriction enzyme S subunit
LDQNYLRWATTGPQWRQEVDRMRNVGAVFDSLNVADIPSLRVPVPSLRLQRRIAATLSALDDKIESNRRALKIAVQLAQTKLLIGSDPVRLGDVAILDKGVSYKGAGLQDQQSETAQPLINLGNFPVGAGWMNRSKIKYYGGDFRDRHVVTGGDVVVANTDLTQQRAVLGRAVLVPLDLGPSLFSHHVFAVRFHARTDLRLALWAQLATGAARDRLTGYATGTTVAALPREALLDFRISTPASSQAVAQADALVTLAWARERESLRLTALRDTLLPELLSGRIRVPEAGEAVESALA